MRHFAADGVAESGQAVEKEVLLGGVVVVNGGGRHVRLGRNLGNRDGLTHSRRVQTHRRPNYGLLSRGTVRRPLDYHGPYSKDTGATIDPVKVGFLDDA